VTAQAWFEPAAIDVAFARYETFTGIFDPIVVPFPSWPDALAPQQ
jgi:hypothetical protein